MCVSVNTEKLKQKESPAVSHTENPCGGRNNNRQTTYTHRFKQGPSRSPAWATLLPATVNVCCALPNAWGAP